MKTKITKRDDGTLVAVNVVVMNKGNGSLNFVTSFEDTKEGNKRAEDLFVSVIKKHDLRVTPEFDEELESAIEDAYWSDSTVYVTISQSVTLRDANDLI